LTTITVGGPPGSGTSTFAKLLAHALSLEYLGAGEAFRQMAAEMGMRLEEFSKLAETDHDIDRRIEDMQIRMARGRDVVVDSRLGAWVIEDPDLRVCLIARLEERARRVAERDGITEEQAISLVSQREESERKRYLDIYGIDTTDMEVYDLVVNSGTYLPQEIVSIVSSALELVQLRKTGKARSKGGCEND